MISGYYQKFKLQPNKYIFQFEFLLKKTKVENVDFLLKIGSVSKCSFEEFKEEEKAWQQYLKKNATI